MNHAGLHVPHLRAARHGQGHRNAVAAARLGLAGPARTWLRECPSAAMRPVKNSAVFLNPGDVTSTRPHPSPPCEMATAALDGPDARTWSAPAGEVSCAYPWIRRNT